MKRAARSGKKTGNDFRRIDQLLHDLSQPTTTLLCSLELALRAGRPAEYERTLHSALARAQEIASLTDRLRQILFHRPSAARQEAFSRSGNSFRSGKTSQIRERFARTRNS